jgi:hypothetical protein
MTLTDKVGKRVLEGRKGSKEVHIVTEPLTKEEAREMYSSRPWNEYSESRFGGDNLTDDEALLLGGDALRCKMCSAPTRVSYLNEDICPDCDGRSEYNGENPLTKR